MINFTDRELRQIYNALVDDVENSMSELDAIKACNNENLFKVSVISGSYGILLDSVESGLTAMRKIIIALGHENEKRKDLKEIDKGLSIAKTNREHIFEKKPF